MASVATPDAASNGAARYIELAKAHWPLLIGFLCLLIPTLIDVGAEAWSRDEGVHGPIVMATGIWLIVRAWPEVKHLAAPGNRLLATLGAFASLCVYVFGRGLSFISLEVMALLGFFLSLAYLYFGLALLKRMWFPILYLGFLIPLPGWVLDSITAPLKEWVSICAENVLGWIGYPIAREGVTLHVAQYQLLVEDACAGMNSIISLTAVGLFYIYLLHNASWRYALFLFCWIIPAALFANLIRVMGLVLITYHMGNEAAQGFLHSTAGIVMFVAALLSIFLVDKIMAPVRNRLSGGRA
jgi:exosortase B